MICSRPSGVSISEHPPLRIYIKPGCPWCDDALAFLDREGLSYESIDVTADRDAFREMAQIFGQTSAPSLTCGELKLADFGVDELIPFLERHGIHP